MNFFRFRRGQVQTSIFYVVGLGCWLVGGLAMSPEAMASETNLLAQAQAPREIAENQGRELTQEEIAVLEREVARAERELKTREAASKQDIYYATKLFGAVVTIVLLVIGAIIARRYSNPRKSLREQLQGPQDEVRFE